MKIQYARLIAVMFALKVCAISAVISYTEAFAGSSERDSSPIFKSPDSKQDSIEEAGDDTDESIEVLFAQISNSELF